MSFSEDIQFPAKSLYESDDMWLTGNRQQFFFKQAVKFISTLVCLLQPLFPAACRLRMMSLFLTRK